MDEGFRALSNVGAKYICRAMASWTPNAGEYNSFPAIKQRIAYAHSTAPEMVFEACIFETCGPEMNSIVIPEDVLEKFGQPVEYRTFDYEKMLFDDGWAVNLWGENRSVPDIEKVETQMFIYHRACTFIDMGFEALHLGQLEMVGRNDKDNNNKAYAKVIGMIREYAKKNARRNWVLINGHHYLTEFKDEDGNWLVDFIMYVVRYQAPADETEHPITEETPQRVELFTYDERGQYHGPAKLGYSGKSPSGWTTEHYPYLLELDNFGWDEECFNKPSATGKDDSIGSRNWVWGMDQISWFANQPSWYRHEWLKYATETIEGYGDNGHFAMPGKRLCYRMDLGKQGYYYMNDKMYWTEGFSDEASIKEIWSNKYY